MFEEQLAGEDFNLLDQGTGTFVRGAEEQHAAPVVIVVRVVDVVLDKLLQGLLRLGNSGFQLAHGLILR
ncbi:hypothetical protein JYG36_12195 [Pseudomonas sp. SORT22]|uniref:hypothetical protein n=1 Tax=Pseudomonas sp. SORT22 TaxID=2813842 RepID=UPI001BCCA837|nr:hypothetical protein [Pseudomonas sp. SORT22]QVM98881.1 hypothetical protein JYG36_12195 [Pseudomonas sp. SORT22]